MTPEIIMAGLLVASGLYITYQWAVISKYRRTLTFATYALEAAYIHITEGKDEDTTE